MIVRGRKNKAAYKKCPQCKGEMHATGYITSNGFDGEKYIPKDGTWGTGSGWQCGSCDHKIELAHRVPVG